MAQRASGVVIPASSKARAYTTRDPPGSDSRNPCAAGDDCGADWQRAGGTLPRAARARSRASAAAARGGAYMVIVELILTCGGHGR